MKYYWTAFNKTTGEIAESGRGTKSVESAHRAALGFVKDSWDDADEVLVEVWDTPNAYSEPGYGRQLASKKKYVREGYNPVHLRKVMRALGETGITEEEFLGELGPWDRKDDWGRTGWVEKDV